MWRGFISVWFVMVGLILLAGKVGQMLPHVGLLAFETRTADSWDIVLLDVERESLFNLTGRSSLPESHAISQTDNPAAMSEFLISSNLGGQPADDLDPRWSPTGEEIIFVSWRDGNAEIYWLQPFSGRLQNLTYSPGNEIAPAWSPDGTQIAYQSQIRGQWDICVLDLESGTVRNLTNDPASDQSPTWSSDGRWIAFESNRDGYWGLYRVEVLSGEQYALPSLGTPSYHPAWNS